MLSQFWLVCDSISDRANLHLTHVIHRSFRANLHTIEVDQHNHYTVVIMRTLLVSMLFVNLPL